MDFVNEEDGTVGGLDLGDDRFQPFFEVAPITGTGQQRPQVEGVDDGVIEHFGHVFFDDAPGQPLGDGRLANPGVADEQRVVLVAPT